MRIKELFTVPEGKKVTEKVFGRVLLSSICSVLLCMVCLTSTTWAWFTASIENKGNEIRIATVTADIAVTGPGGQIDPLDDGSYSLESGTSAVKIKLNRQSAAPEDISGAQNPVYVIMTVTHGTDVQHLYFTFERGGEDTQSRKIVVEGSAAVSFCVAWVKPVAAEPVGSGDVFVGAAPQQEPSTETTAAPTESTEEQTVVPTTQPSQAITTEDPGDTEAGAVQ